MSDTTAVSLHSSSGGNAINALGINHLQPVYPYFLGEYNQAVFQALIGSRRAALWMVCRPSFEPEYALFLYAEEPKARRLPREWILATANAAQQIYLTRQRFSASTSDSRSLLDSAGETLVNRKGIVVDELFIETLRDVWMAVLRLTRYADSSYGMLDGVVYEFGAGAHLCGTTHSPASGLPAEIVALALKLEKLVGAEENQQAALKEECLAEAKRLTKAAKAEAVKLGFRKDEGDER